MLVTVLIAGASTAQVQTTTQPPSAVIVLLGESELSRREITAVLEAATAEMNASSGYRLDPMASLQAGGEAVMRGCTLDYDCLLQVAQGAEVDAVLGVKAEKDERRTLRLELLWVAADARGLPGESDSKIARNPAALAKAVRRGVQKIIPLYARKGVGGLTVLAEAGSEILLDGQLIGTAPMEKPAIVSVGVHRVDAVTPNRVTVTRSVEISEARRHVVDLPTPSRAVAPLSEAPPPPRAPAIKTASFVVGGAGLLAFAGGMYFGLQTQGLNGQIQSGACSETPCTTGLSQVEAHRLYDQANTQATIGNIGVTTGVLMMAGAGLMYWLGSQDEEEPTP